MNCMRLLLALFVVVALLPVVPVTTASHVASSEIRWACGGGGGHPDDCGINAIHDPSFDEPPWIDDEDRVMGVVIGGEARAYAIKQLDRHEVVNDFIAGKPVAVTWCPLCGSAIVFERIAQIEGEARLLDLEVSGYLYKHDLVMWDHQTNTLWNQIAGEPIGTLQERRVQSDHVEGKLSFVPSELTSWGDWRERHPGTKLLDRETANGRPINYGQAYPGYDSNCRFGISGQSQCDVEGLHPKEEVVGVSHEGNAVAYPVFAVRQSGGVVVDDLLGRSVVVATGQGGGVRVFDGADHGFTTEGERWVDREGRGWDLWEGKSDDGFEQLEHLEHLVLFWFAWNELHDGTELWLPDDLEGAMARQDTSGIPAPAWAAMLFMVLILMMGARRRRSKE